MISCSPATQAQVEVAKAKDIACHHLDAGDLERSGAQLAIDWMLAKLASCKPGGAVLLASTTSPEELERIQQQIGRNKAASLVEEAMADLAKSARDAGVSHFIVAGGETSGAVTQALNVVDVQIGPEIARGVPWIYGQDGSGSLALKSGNFGARSFFFDALSHVHEKRN